MFKVLTTHGPGGPLSVSIRPFVGGGAGHSFVTTPESKALQQAKNEIDLFYEEGKWDDYKKITNPYEYIFLSWNRRSSRSVATRQPLSRSYFKMIELWKQMDLDTSLADLVAKDGGLITAHAAEGPGGFIEACTISAERLSWPFLNAFAITLRSEAKNVPGWRKAAKFLETFPQIQIHDGADGTGNILLRANQDAFVDRVGSTVHLFTADGGFDFSSDYNAQEDSIFPLLLAETLIGLRVLSRGGALVIKCFDTTEQPTLDLIWLISRAFATWGVVKPRTSRAGNAERYIVCKGFLGDCEDIIAMLHSYQDAANFKLPILATPTACDSWKPFLSQIAALQEQIEHVEILVIQETLELIKHTDATIIKNLVRANVLRSIEWCEEHGEAVATSWTSDLDRNVSKEASDLLHILNPSNSLTYSGWTHRTTSTCTLSFEGFRSGAAMPPPSHNPFMRLKPVGSSNVVTFIGK